MPLCPETPDLDHSAYSKAEHLRHQHRCSLSRERIARATVEAGSAYERPSSARVWLLPISSRADRTSLQYFLFHPRSPTVRKVSPAPARLRVRTLLVLA